MTITRTNLPDGYVAYPRLTLCSNVMVDGGHLLEINGTLPIVIGQGPSPLVWLQAPADPAGKQFALLVAASKSVHPAMSVEHSENGISILARGVLVLHVYAGANHEAVVDSIDLRPVGYNLVGDASSLNAGGMKLSRNTANGAQVLISLGGVA